MYNAEFFGTFDITALCLTAFTLFFFGLIVYLRRESRREGFPLEDDGSGRLASPGLLFFPPPKTFRLARDLPDVSKPDGSPDRDPLELRSARRSNVSGTPLQPGGDPMVAGVGPGAYANRAAVPDLTDHGELKIAPLRAAPDFVVDGRDADPRGMVVVGADKVRAGVVSDVWIDRGEILIRYLEVTLDAPAAGLTVVGEAPAGRSVLLPMTMAVISRRTGRVKVNAILGSQFGGVPPLSAPDRVTRDEEERICAYYGGGFLYATPARAEPWL